ncbi:hypothetical protein [Streptomyces tendae]
MARVSEEWATKNGLHALHQAEEAVKRCVSNVGMVQDGLKAGYQGSDGYRYNDLLAEWQNKARTILSNLGNMITSLETNAAEVAKNQAEANEMFSARAMATANALKG